MFRDKKKLNHHPNTNKGLGKITKTFVCILFKLLTYLIHS